MEEKTRGKGAEGDGTGSEARDLIQRLMDDGMTQEQIGNAISRSTDTVGAIFNSEIENPPEDLIERLRRIVSRRGA